MRGLTKVEKMPLFTLLRRLVYPALEEHLDKAFPEFNFRPVSNGWWVAQDAPIHYREYGHLEGKLVARGWGFRSLKPELPPVFWLAYANKQKFPKNPDLKPAIQSLAQRVRIVFEWEVSEEELHEAQESVRRHLLPEAILVHAQSELWTVEGKAARNYLTAEKGIPESRLLPLEIGFISTSDALRKSLHDAGFNSTLDDERAGATGIYQPHWQERIVGPWRDRFGRSVFNLWGLRFPFLTGDEPLFDYLRRVGGSGALGSRDVPLHLHLAARKSQRNLLLVESPLSALSPFLKGLQNPFPIATGGNLTEEQVQVLEKYLRKEGSLTVNLDYDPDARGGVHTSTYEALDMLRTVSFPVHVIDPVRMQSGTDLPERVDPERFLKHKGMQGYVELLKTRVPADRFTPLEPEEDKGIF